MKSTAVTLGVLYALLCQAVAFMMTGAGHGWATPFFWGLLGLLVFPLCFCAAPTTGERRLRITVLLLAVVATLGADLILIERSFDEGLQYFERAAPLAYVWTGLWLVGQLPLLYAVALTLVGTSHREA